MFSASQGAVAATEAAYIEDVFSTWLYTGTGGTQTITNGIDLAGKGGLVWMKTRSGATAHALYDTARGSTFDLASNTTAAQTTQSTGLTGFLSNGFSIGSLAKINTNAATYASWTFREQPRFFDVVTYTGNAINGTAISHSLGAVPGCIIIKRTDGTGDWFVHHRSYNGGVNPTQYTLYLNTTAALQGPGNWSQFQAPTSGAFYPTGGANSNGATYVAYLFAHDAGGFGATGADNVISCGSFTTDGSGNATVNLGYEPQWVLVKPSSTTESWYIVDSMRGLTVNPGVASDNVLVPNATAAETGRALIEPTATGFVLAPGGWLPVFATMIYIAIRRGPMRTPTSGTSVYSSQLRVGTGATANVSGFGFPVDLYLMQGARSVGTTRSQWRDRLRGASLGLESTGSGAEFTDSTAVLFFTQSGFQIGASTDINTSGYNYVDHTFRRAPGFFDVVCYTGTGSARTVAHNLGVVPELMIVKSRSANSTDWAVYHTSLGATRYIELNSTAQFSTSSAVWNNTDPTSSVFTVGTNARTNTNAATYVAYLFASCPGVSKVGSYTGTGATQVINCGFAAGARFVLIKRTDSTGDWYVWDSARGIVAGNDPYLTLNTTAAEVTNTDWVDTAASGFELSNAGGNLANTNGASYIFLAIA
jgi:hypothetical protein